MSKNEILDEYFESKISVKKGVIDRYIEAF